VFLYTLLVIPILGIFWISSTGSYNSVSLVKDLGNDDARVSNLKFERILNDKEKLANFVNKQDLDFSDKDNHNSNLSYNFSFEKKIALIFSVLNLIVSLIIYILFFDFSNQKFQFIQEHYDLSFYDIYLGVDGISIYFVLLTTIITPIALISN
jgi:NADH-ubiquinone oxidoreductase chain 4